MKYAIYLDDVESETFETDEKSAMARYIEEKGNYIQEDIYDTIKLVRLETVMEDDLNGQKL